MTSAGGSSTAGSCGTAGDTTPFTLVTWRGTATTYTVDPSATTTFGESGVTSPTYADVCVGEVVGAIGTVAGDTVTASAVYVSPAIPPQPQGAFGTVTSAGGSSTAGSCGTAGDTTAFTITSWKGTTTYTVDLTGTTTFVEPDVTGPSYADVCVGETVGATGAVAGNTVTATTVFVAPVTKPPRPAGNSAR